MEAATAKRFTVKRCKFVERTLQVEKGSRSTQEKIPEEEPEITALISLPPDACFRPRNRQAQNPSRTRSHSVPGVSQTVHGRAVLHKEYSNHHLEPPTAPPDDAAKDALAHVFTVVETPRARAARRTLDRNRSRRRAE
jgi:hypothetical protein